MSRSKKVTWGKDPFSQQVDRFPSSKVEDANRQAEVLMRQAVEKKTGKAVVARAPERLDKKHAPHAYWTTRRLLIQARMSTQKNVPPDLKPMVQFLRGGAAWMMSYTLLANAAYEDPVERWRHLDRILTIAALMRACCRVLRDLRVLAKPKKGGQGDDGGSAVSSLMGQMIAEFEGWKRETEERITSAGGTVPQSCQAGLALPMPEIPYIPFL